MKNNNLMIGKRIFRLQLSPYQRNCSKCALKGYADCQDQVKRLTGEGCSYKVAVELFERED